MRDSIEGAMSVPYRLIPPLEPGDRLSPEEFGRRYAEMANLKKAELIEGRVYMADPVRTQRHGNPQALMTGWLAFYHAATPGTYLSVNTTVRLDLDNEPQPDIFLRWHPEYGGQSKLTKDDLIEGPPELVVEIASSSTSYALHDKLEVYRRCGVKEYLVWQVMEEQLKWHQLNGNRYQVVHPVEGIIASKVFRGLSLDVNALIHRNFAQVLVHLQRNLA